MKKIQFLLYYVLFASIIAYSQENNFELIMTDPKCIHPASDIIAWWPYDDTSSTIAEEITSNLNGALINGASFINGEVGNAIHFDGINDYLGIPDNDIWAFDSSNFTIELWANWDIPGGGSIGHPGDVLISNDEGSGIRKKWFFALGGGVLYFHINGSNNNGFYPQVPFSPVVGKWYHLAITRNYDVFTIYIDGVPEGSETKNVNIPNPNAPLVIGQSNEPFGGFMNGSLDEVTIYDKALSDIEIKDIFDAGNAGKCKDFSIKTDILPIVKLGDFISLELKAVFGEYPYTWKIVKGVLPFGVELSNAGELNGTPTVAGEFTFTINAIDNNNEIDEKTFVLKILVTLPTHEIIIKKSSTVAVPGRELDYFILVENTGNITANDIEIVEILDLKYFSLLKTQPQAIDSLTTSEASFIVWTIPELIIGEPIVLTYKVLLNPSTPLGINITGSACAGIELGDRLSECLIKLARASLECSVCVPSCSSIGPGCGTILACWPTIYICSTCMLGVGPQGPAGCGPRAIDVYECFKSLGNDCFSDDKPTIGPKDPNEMVVLPGKYIQPDQRLTYITHFENIGQIEAKDVFVTVVLDDPNLDLSTLEILSPNGAMFNEATRTIRWELFNKNLLPGETDNVMLSIKPLPDLPSGTEIHNKANIQFDIFDVYTTNEVINIIDSIPPKAWMNPLSKEIDSTRFLISWTGIDTIGEISNYSVFVSTDSSGYVPYIKQTNDTSNIFIGEVGRKYEFICIAEDMAGNIEIQEPIGESSTRISMVTSIDAQSGNLHEASEMIKIYPNPFNTNASIKIEIFKTSYVRAIIYDMLGREIIRIADGQYNEGMHLLTWDGKDNKNIPVDSGLFIISIQIDELREVQKILLIK